MNSESEAFVSRPLKKETFVSPSTRSHRRLHTPPRKPSLFLSRSPLLTPGDIGDFGCSNIAVDLEPEARRIGAEEPAEYPVAASYPPTTCSCGRINLRSCFFHGISPLLFPWFAAAVFPTPPNHVAYSNPYPSSSSCGWSWRGFRLEWRCAMIQSADSAASCQDRRGSRNRGPRAVAAARSGTSPTESRRRRKRCRDVILIPCDSREAVQGICIFLSLPWKSKA